MLILHIALQAPNHPPQSPRTSERTGHYLTWAVGLLLFLIFQPWFANKSTSSFQASWLQMNQTWNCQDIFGTLLHLDTISIYFLCKSWWNWCSNSSNSDVQVTREDAIASCPWPQFANQRPVIGCHTTIPQIQLCLLQPRQSRCWWPLHHLRWEGSVWMSICAVYELPTKSLDPTKSKKITTVRDGKI